MTLPSKSAREVVADVVAQAQRTGYGGEFSPPLLEILDALAARIDDLLPPLTMLPPLIVRPASAPVSADDFGRIKGIGASTAVRLREQGIVSFAQLAAVAQSLPGLPPGLHLLASDAQWENWAAQASVLIEYDAAQAAGEQPDADAAPETDEPA